MAGDTNGVADVFLRDLNTNITTRVSFNLDGTQRQFTSGGADISGDGRFVAYTNNSQIFVYDTQTGLTQQALTNFNGGLGSGFGPSLSHTGDYVVFQSNANNLVPYDSNTQFNISDVFAAPLGTLQLGGTIWNDNGASGGTAGNGIKDGAEPGFFSVSLSLFLDSNDDNIPDNLNAPIQTTITAADGSYRFTNLAADNYIVRVDQTNFVFADGDGFAQLVNTPLSPVTTPEPIDPDNDTDDDDNGARVGGQAAFSNAITLSAGGEPTSEDGNSSTNFTLDFAFLANVPPVINNLNGNTVAFTEDSLTAVRLDQNLDATVTDANQNQLSGGGLTATVTSGNLQDQLSIATDDTILISGSTVQFDADGAGTNSTPVTIGTVTGLNSSSLAVTFTTPDATLAAIGSLIQHLAYQNTNPGNPPTSRSVVVAVNDGFSTSTNATVTVNINQVNDAPTVNAATLPAVTTDETNPPGQSVATLFAGALFTDPDNPAATITGILVSDNVADALTEGAWQYSTDAGTNWFDIGTVSGSSALALNAATLIRFVPTAGFEGSADALSVFGLDNTYVAGFSNGATRVTQDAVTTNGGISAISDNPTTIGTTVNPPLNDEPTLTATAVNPTFTEGDASPADIFTQPIAASTVEGGQTFTSMTVRVTNLTDGADEILNFDGSPVALTDGNVVITATNGLSVSVILLGMTATLTFSGASLDATQLQTLIDGLSYQNNSQIPTDGDRVVTITQLIDSGSNIPPSDNTATPNVASTVNVNPVDDEPTLSATAANPTFVENDPSPADLFTQPIVAATVEPGQTFASMTLTVSNVTDAGERLTINGANVDLTNGNNVPLPGNAGTATVSLTGTTATVTLSGATLTVPELEALVDGLGYENLNDNPTDANRVVTITQLVDSGSNISPNDNISDTLTVASIVNVDPANDQPIVTVNAAAATYTENDAGATVDPTLTVLDPDSASLTGATVTITDALTGDELRINGLLSGTVGGIDFSFSGNTLTLMNAATPAQYQAALRLVTFNSTSENPTTFDNDTTRLIDWQVTDGITPSAVATTTLTITPLNDQPHVDAPAQLGGPQGNAITISNIIFSDIDGGESPQAEIATFHAVQGSFTAAFDPNVTVDDTDAKNVTLTGTLAALNAYITAGSLTYSTPQLETISVTLNDLGNTGGGDLFETENIDIVINLAPVVTAGNTIHYTEQFPVPGPINPVVINGALTVDDPDGTDIDHASVTISAGFTSGDELRVNGQTSGTDVVGNIDFTFSSNTLIVSDIDTEANYQAFLRLVTFNNTTITPDFFGFKPERTITWVVNDGIAESASGSASQTTIVIDPINSPPEIVDLLTPLTYGEGTEQGIGFDAFVNTVDGPAPIVGGTISISSGHIAGDRITWLNRASGTDFDNAIQFAFDPVTGVFTFSTIDPGSADYETFFLRLRYSFRADDNPLNLAFGDDPSAGGANPTRTLTWQVDDGGVSPSLSAPVDQTIIINAINDAPVVTAPTGTLDLVTANTSGDATVLLGDGTGAFAFATPVHPVGAAPNSVALGDLNGDLFLDIVTANSSNNVSVLLGDGLGGFTPQNPYPVAGLAKGVALGDLNGDTILDIVTANDGGDVSVLLGDGLGGFSPGPQPPNPVGAAPNSVALADLNGDGNLDIVTADLGSDAIDPADDGVSVLLGDGLGGFAAATQHPAGTAPSSVELGEISGDNRPDIVVANLGTNNYTVLINFSFGIFSQGPQFVSDTINDIALGDLNGDGELDVVAGIGAGANGAIEVRFGNGFSNFAPTQPPTPVPDTPSTVGLGDVNGDGRLDIVATHLASSTFSLLLNQGGGLFTVVPPQPIVAGSGPISLALGYLDNAQVIDEDTALVLTGLSLTDPDAGSADVAMTLSVANGTLTVAAGIGLALANNGTDTVTLTGRVAEINTALTAGVVYLSDLNFNGSDTLTITANDNGNTGAGGALSATGLISLIINAVNDTPTVDVLTPASVTEDVASPVTGITFGDVEAEAENATVVATLSVPSGSLAATSIPGVGVGGNSSAMTLTGTVAAINAFIAASSVTYTTVANATADVTLTVEIDDGGNTGTGGAKTDSDAVTLTVTAVNDTPVNTAPAGPLVVTEDTDLLITGLSVADLDAGAGTLTTTLSALNGTLSVGLTGGAAVADSGTSSVTLTGTVAQINGTLASGGNVVYRGNLNFAGADTVTMLTNDAGNTGVDPGLTGNGTSEQDSDPIAITVTAVNDAPVNVVPASIAVVEDVASALTGIPFTDVDAAGASVTASLSVPSGSLAAASGGGVTVGGSPVAMTLTGTVAAINAFIAASNVTYTTAANATANVTLTVAINDGGNTGTGGAKADSDTVTLAVTAVNDAPAGLDKTVTFDEDTAYTFAAADFGFSDPVEGNALAGVRITTLPGAGSLTNNNVAVTAGQLVSVAAINAGLLKFTPAANANGAAYAALTFQVQDDGGTAAGGIDLDPTPNNFTFNVNPTNDAPTDIVGGPLSINENSGIGTLVGTLTGIDPENQTLAYALTDNAGGRFAINNLGQVTVANGVLLDAEQSTLHGIGVRVTDTEGFFFDKAFVVAVNDLNPEVAIGDDGANTLLGGFADDTINGNAGDDVLVGGGGNDYITSGDGNDKAFGEAGNDTVIGANGDDYLNGGADDDLIIGNDGADTLLGDAGDDYLDGGAGDDLVMGGVGNDTVLGADGNDYVNGEDGNDQVFGGEGVDTLLGADGDDYLNGENGNDIVFGDGGNDTVIGGEGDDYLSAGAGDDNLVGGNGNDTLFAGSGSDYLQGDGGDDFFVFDGTFQTSIIIDFEPGTVAHHDVIQFTGGVFADFADMMSHAVQSATNTVITDAGGHTLTLANVVKANLISDDFVFV